MDLYLRYEPDLYTISGWVTVPCQFPKRYHVPADGLIAPLPSTAKIRPKR